MVISGYLSILCVHMSEGQMYLGLVHTSNSQLHQLGVQGVVGYSHVGRGRLVWELVWNT